MMRFGFKLRDNLVSCRLYKVRFFELSPGPDTQREAITLEA